MTARILVVAFLFAVAIAGTAAPSSAAGWDIGVNGGIGIPTGDFASEDQLDGKTGPQFGVDICYHASEVFGIGVDASYNKNKHANEGTVEDLGGGTTLTANKDQFVTWQYGVHGKYMFRMEGKMKPFAMVGVGLYDIKEDYEYTYFDPISGKEVFTDESDNAEQPGSRFGWKLGLGADYFTSPKFGIGVGFDYNSISMDKDKFDVSTVPYFSARLRLTYRMMK